MKRVLFLVIIAVAVLGSAVVHASSVDDRVSALEKRLAAIEQSNINRNTGYASSQQQIEKFGADIAAMKGAVDAANALTNSLSVQLNSKYTELERRIQSLEDQLRLIQDMLKRGGGSAGGVVATEEYLAWQAASEKMGASEYLQAASAFLEFIKNFPKSKLAGDAQFQVGECYYQARDYQQAIKQFQVFIERNPRSTKVAEALYKQGSSFAELGMKDEAKAFFTKVTIDYPSSSAAPQAKAKIDRLEGRATVTAENHQGPAPAVEFEYPTETIWQIKERQKAAAQQQQAPGTTQTQKPAVQPQAATPQQNNPPPKRERVEF